MIDSHGRARNAATAVIVLLGALGLLGATTALAVPGDTHSAQQRARHHHGRRGHHHRSRHHRRHVHGGSETVTPIRHVIVIIGENHTFDNVFATYRAPGRQHVRNLLSEGIVTASGAPRGSGG